MQIISEREYDSLDQIQEEKETFIESFSGLAPRRMTFDCLKQIENEHDDEATPFGACAEQSFAADSWGQEESYSQLTSQSQDTHSRRG